MSKMKEKNIQSKCDVCGNDVFIDQYGNGDECPNCSWVNCAYYEEFPDRVMCPNLISLNKAKKLYADGKTFLPDLDDFIGGLDFYGEMDKKLPDNQKLKSDSSSCWNAVRKYTAQLSKNYKFD